MKKLFLIFLSIFLFLFSTVALTHPKLSYAADPVGDLKSPSQNLFKYSFGGAAGEDGKGESFGFLHYGILGPIAGSLTGLWDENCKVVKSGMLPQSGKAIAMLYENQPSGREYVADLLDNIGIPTVSSAYAQGTGYTAMTPFLPFWKVFRNLAYSLYIIMFVVVGIMIMLRTKVNAQTIITIQTALPNLLITLLLITFSYAIVGFMIDLMYFLIYFIVYLISSTGIITTPVQTISRLMSYSAWSVVFEGRNTIISAVSLALGEALSGLGTGSLEIFGTLASVFFTPAYLIVAVYLAINMIKLMIALIKSYVMIIVQTITAPVQILMNAMPGSKAFSTWLKTTASYLIPFPVAAAMFIFSAILIGNPTKASLAGCMWLGESNPFAINGQHELYANYYTGTAGDSKGTIWLPPFTLTSNSKVGLNWQGAGVSVSNPADSVDVSSPDVMVLIGFFILCMTPSVVKMAQEWLQIKESPYASEAMSGFMGVATAPIKGVGGLVKHRWQLAEQEKLYKNIGSNGKVN